MKNFIVFCLVISLSFLNACTVISAPNNSFFARMNSYIAMPEDSEWTISLTIFSSTNNMSNLTSDIVNVEFEGLSTVIPINDYSLSYLTSTDAYSTYSFEITFSSTLPGVFQSCNIVFTKGDNSKFSYGIGDWVFDVGERPSKLDLLNTYSSPAASSNAEYFAYSYEVLSGSADIIQIFFGNNLSVESQTGLNLEDKLKLESDSPAVYIRSKIIVNYNNNHEIFYGIGCYCGALDFDMNDIAISKSYSNYREFGGYN